jgi:hypothetical protein
MPRPLVFCSYSPVLLVELRWFFQAPWDQLIAWLRIITAETA